MPVVVRLAEKMIADQLFVRCPAHRGALGVHWRCGVSSMDGDVLGIDSNSAERRSSNGKSTKRSRAASSTRVASDGEAGLSQVSVSVSKDILHAFDAISRDTGVNRGFLMREALTMYAALLASGQRVYQTPWRRVG